jgi:F0F1-type ATP synthase membrane subunit b/b'
MLNPTMLNVVLSHSSLGWDFVLQFGSSDAVLAVGPMALPFLAFACIAIGVLAAVSGGNGNWGCGRRRGWSRFWGFPIVIVLIVLACREFKDHRRTWVAVPARPVEARHERLEDVVARLEKQLDQVDRALDRSANQLDRQLDHSTNDIERQVDHGTTELVRQLQATVAQIRRQVEHVGHQIQQQHLQAAREIVRRETPARLESVADIHETPAVIEPKPPALPISGFIPVDVPIPAIAPVASPAPPAAAVPAVAAEAWVSPAKPSADSHEPNSDAKTPSSSPTAANDTTASSQSDKLPEWAKTEIVDEGKRKLVVVPGGFAATEKEAEQDSLEAARLVVADGLSRANPKVGNWAPSAHSVHETAVRHTYIEKIHRKTVSTGTPFVVYRAYQQVELSPTVYQQLLTSWRDDVLPGRLWALGGIAVLLTLTFATGAAYFRLDDRTHGRYRVPLKMAAAAIISACLAAAAVTVFV